MLYLLGLVTFVLIAWGWAIHRLRTRGRLVDPVGLPRPSWPSWMVPVFLIGYVSALIVGTSAWLAWVLDQPPDAEDLPPQLTIQASIAGNLAVMLVLGGLTLAIRFGRPASRELGLDLDRRGFQRAVGVGVGGVLLVLPWVYAVGWMATWVWPETTHPLEEMLRERQDWTTLGLAILAGCVLAPLTEEWLFRGILLPMFTRWGCRVFTQAQAVADERGVQDNQNLGSRESESGGLGGPNDSVTSSWVGAAVTREPATTGLDRERLEAGRGGPAFWIANVLVALLFAALHATEWPAPVPIFVLALGLGEMARQAGSVLAPIVAHVLFNANSVVLVIVTGAASPDQVSGSPNADPPAVVTSVETLSG